MLTSPHLLKIWGPGLVLLFITTYIIILGIHIAGPSNSPSSQCLDILHSTHLSFHAAVTTSKQSPLHGSPLCLASTSALSCSLILVLPFLPFSHLTGIWNSWSFPLFIVHHGPHVFTLPLAWLRVHSTTHLPKSFVNTLNLLAPLWLHYIYWGGKKIYYYPYIFCLHTHPEAAQPGVGKLQSLDQRWTTPCFYSFIGIQTQSFTYVLSVSVFTPPWQS